ncbi:uncharacterized protein LOC141852595 [Brevipalpus obovatus]|uniref:uncharacterized protein LOC141852595 n=1 Tax=Brevipalpus obovatus TaxID=246614 RepID=UPI003D9F454D
MSEGRSSFSNLSLPRGLMTRSGFPPDPNQRLPSFKNSLTKSSLIFQTNPSLVRSPIKPNLTSKSQERSKTCKANTNGVNKSDILKQTPPRNTNAKLRRPSRQGNKYKPKKLVQLESTVFTGVPLKPATSRSARSSSSSKAPPKSPAIVLAPPVVEHKVPVDDAIEEELLRDDFIENEEERKHKPEILPQGWQNLCELETSLPSIEPSTDSVLTSPGGEGLVFLQLPKFFPTKSNGPIGKLRVWKSGKIEIVSRSNGKSYDICPANASFSEERSPNAEASFGVNEKPSSARELVAYQGRGLTFLGSINLSDTAVVVPRISTSKENRTKRVFTRPVIPKLERS